MTAKWECVVLPGAEKHEIIKELKNDKNATALVKLHIIGKVPVTDIKKLRLLILKKIKENWGRVLILWVQNTLQLQRYLYALKNVCSLAIKNI